MVSVCSLLRPKSFKRGQALQHVEEVRAHPAQLFKPALAQLFGARPDDGEQEDEQRSGDDEDQPRERVEPEDDEEDQRRYQRREQARRLVLRDVLVQRLDALDGCMRQLAAALVARRERALAQFSQEAQTHFTLDPARAALRDDLAAPLERRAHADQQKQQDEQWHDSAERSGRHGRPR